MACWHTSIEKLDNGAIYIKSGNRGNSYYGKFRVGKIVGRDPKYTFSRVFINDTDGAYIKEPGFYEVFRSCRWGKRPEIYYLVVVLNNGVLEYDTTTKVEILNYLDSIGQ